MNLTMRHSFCWHEHLFIIGSVNLSCSFLARFSWFTSSLSPGMASLYLLSDCCLLIEINFQEVIDEFS